MDINKIREVIVYVALLNFIKAGLFPGQSFGKEAGCGAMGFTGCLFFAPAQS